MNNMINTGEFNTHKDGRGQALKESKAASQAARVEKIKGILKKTKGIEFKNITALSEFVAEQFKLQYEEVISDSTLRRNKYYKRLLERTIDKVDVAVNEMGSLQQDLILEQSENYSLKQELATTKKVLSEQLSLISELKQKSLTDRIDGQLHEDIDDSAFKIIMKLLEHIDGFKIETSGIYDHAVAGNPLLVISADASPSFFKWYFENSEHKSKLQ